MKCTSGPNYQGLNAGAIVSLANVASLVGCRISIRMLAQLRHADVWTSTAVNTNDTLFEVVIYK